MIYTVYSMNPVLYEKEDFPMRRLRTKNSPRLGAMCFAFVLVVLFFMPHLHAEMLVRNAEDLQAAVHDKAISLLILGADIDIDDPGEEGNALDITHDLTIDLSGYTLRITTTSNSTNGMKVHQGSVLTVQDSYVLSPGALLVLNNSTVSAEGYGAGINTAEGYLVLQGGMITSQGGFGGAGLGGGNQNAGGDINVAGTAFVTAHGGLFGAGIGGGYGGDGGKIHITEEAVVDATGDAAAGIGGGGQAIEHGGKGGTIRIDGFATVTATGKSGGAGIGGGSGDYGGTGGNIIIAGNAVVRTVGEGGAGIGGGLGGGLGGEGAHVTFADSAIVFAEGQNGAAGVGGAGGYDTGGAGGDVFVCDMAMLEAENIDDGVGIGGGTARNQTLAAPGTLTITGGNVMQLDRAKGDIYSRAHAENAAGEMLTPAWIVVMDENNVYLPKVDIHAPAYDYRALTNGTGAARIWLPRYSGTDISISAKGYEAYVFTYTEEEPEVREVTLYPKIVKPLVLQIGSDEVWRGDTLVEAPPVVPQIVEGRTMLPFRYLIQTLLGGTVEWDAATQIITAHIQGVHFRITIGSSQVTIDGNVLDFGWEPILIEGHTLVPLRFFESAVESIAWNADTRTVTIIEKP